MSTGQTLYEVDQQTWQTTAIGDFQPNPDKVYAVAPLGGDLWIFTFPTPGGAIVRYDLSTKTMTPVASPSTAPFVVSAAAPLACSP